MLRVSETSVEFAKLLSPGLVEFHSRQLLEESLGPKALPRSRVSTVSLAPLDRFYSLNQILLDCPSRQWVEWRWMKQKKYPKKIVQLSQSCVSTDLSKQQSPSLFGSTDKLRQCHPENVSTKRDTGINRIQSPDTWRVPFRIASIFFRFSRCFKIQRLFISVSWMVSYHCRSTNSQTVIQPWKQLPEVRSSEPSWQNNGRVDWCGLSYRNM